MDRLGPFEDEPRLAVAVSGGADSLCLAHLAKEWVSERGGRITALIVDHGLREESANEALTVASRLEAHDIDCQILKWTGLKPKTAIQQQARNARYRLLTQACEQLGIFHLLVAHHLNDQIETVAMRKERNSGTIGLAGMSSIREMGNVRIIRPLLRYPKAALIDHLKSRNIDWIEDPSNADSRFWRSRFRIGDKPAQNGPQPLQGDQAMATRLAIESQLCRFSADYVQFHPWGFLKIDAEKLHDAGDDIAHLVLSSAIAAVTGRSKPQRQKALRQSLQELRSGVLQTTLGHALIKRKGDHIFIMRENRDLPRPISLGYGESCRWDCRIWIENRFKDKRLRVSSMDNSRLPGPLKKLAEIDGIPKLVLQTWPYLAFDDASDGHHGLAFAGENGVKVFFPPVRTFTGAPFAV